ncbi:MAG: maltokinase N-terminal cap-like domain-containing protein [Acidimicrobiales bacterium]
MAILHQVAKISPSKLEMLEVHLGGADWLAGFVGDDIALVAAYRFDDPDGLVGIETHLVTSDSGHVLQIPLTYRNDPLEGADHWLLGSMEHSVLGTRWVYDACGDPVFVTALARVIATGGSHAELIVETPDGQVERQPNMTVKGSGSGAWAARGTVSVERRGTDTHLDLDGSSLVVRHALDDAAAPPGADVLTGSWDSMSAILATLSP